MSFLSVLLVSGKYGTRHFTDLSEASGCIHIALWSSPACLTIHQNLSFNLQAVRPPARADSALNGFQEVWFLDGYCTSWIVELPMQLCLLKCILLLKNKRNNLYSLTKVLKKMNFLVSQQIFPKLILPLQILVFYLQMFIGFWVEGTLQTKVQLHLKQKPALQTHT